MDQIAEDFKQALLSLDKQAARNIIEQSNGNISSIQLVEKIVVPVLENIGKGWLEGKYALSQIFMSGKIVEELVDTFLPPGDLNRIDQPPMAITVLEDYHMLGKRVVYSVLRSSGYELVDYGQKNVDELVQKVVEDKIKILLISVLMLPSALKIKEVVEKLEKMSVDVKIIVGGAPFRFDTTLWKEVKADAMGYHASDINAILESLIGELS
ncbi:B12-binding domain-containing protein [candidate division KSB1 bacterium]